MTDNSHTVRAMIVILSVGCVAGEVNAQATLDAELKPFLGKYELPALAAAVVKDGKVVASGAVGTRRHGTDAPVTIDDRFHVGSNTKAMTALLAALLVEEKKLRWDSTVAEVFPELTKAMDRQLKTVTLRQLLSHTSGLPGDNKDVDELIDKATLRGGNLDEARYWMVKQWCSRPLAAEPGKKWAYSNLGYVFAGAMMERTPGKSWDEMIQERVFAPLGLKSAGLGCQSSLGKVDAPLGHKIVEGKTKAFMAGPGGDSPLVLGPAGIAHLSVLDFAKWAGWNAGQGKRGPKLVRPETWKTLHAMVVSDLPMKERRTGTPTKGKYGLGWGEVEVKWSDTPVLFHGGSNTMNLAHVWVDPKRDFAMVLMTNVGGEKAEDALFQAAARLAAKHAGPKRQK
jgi:CubicO group peptidase (beta-lactamase class C family)